MSDKEKRVKKDNVRLRTIFSSALIILVVMILGNALLIYAFGANGSLEKMVEKIVPYPAISINNSNFLTFGEIYGNLAAVKNFYEKQDFSQVGMRIDFSTPEGEKRLKIKEKEIINRMTEDLAIEVLAKKEGIIIKGSEVDQNVMRSMQEYGTNGELTQKRLLELYGWTISDFKEKVVKPDMYRKALEAVFRKQDDSSKQAKEQIEKALKELQGGKKFEDVVATYSRGVSAKDGGELGWFEKNQLIPDISEKVFALKKGERSEILESSLGFHIVEVEEVKGEGDDKMVKIRQIIAPRRAFIDWAREKMKDLKVSVFMKDYSWDSGKLIVDFADKEMKKFEEDLVRNSQGDPSVGI